MDNGQRTVDNAIINASASCPQAARAAAARAATAQQRQHDTASKVVGC
ncbi:MAG: hypothetical protein IKR25_01195 [Muribaculaceae bacterium]|nr:hypothetical protein [Muribaculaceae bacterium]